MHLHESMVLFPHAQFKSFFHVWFMPGWFQKKSTLQDKFNIALVFGFIKMCYGWNYNLNISLHGFHVSTIFLLKSMPFNGKINVTSLGTCLIMESCLIWNLLSMQIKTKECYAILQFLFNVRNAWKWNFWHEIVTLVSSSTIWAIFWSSERDLLFLTRLTYMDKWFNTKTMKFKKLLTNCSLVSLVLQDRWDEGLLVKITDWNVFLKSFWNGKKDSQAWRQELQQIVSKGKILFAKKPPEHILQSLQRFTRRTFSPV